MAPTKRELMPESGSVDTYANKISRATIQKGCAGQSDPGLIKLDTAKNKEKEAIFVAWTYLQTHQAPPWNGSAVVTRHKRRDEKTGEA